MTACGVACGVKANAGNVDILFEVTLADGTVESVSFTLTPEKTQGIALGLIRGALVAQGHMPRLD